MASPVAIVMMDPRHATSTGGRPLYSQLAFDINRRYACAHRYDVMYLRMRGSVCEHPLLGERHPSYCKLVAVAEALSRGYELVAFLDSDAFFQNASMPLPQLLADYAGNATSLRQQSWDVAFASDRPFSFGPNAGVQFWRNTPTAQRLLRHWWHLPGGRFHSQHDYEQHALQWLLLHCHAAHIALLGLQSMSLQLDVRGWPLYEHPIAHIDHGRNFFRMLIMSIVLLRSVGQSPEVCKHSEPRPVPTPSALACARIFPLCPHAHAAHHEPASRRSCPTCAWTVDETRRRRRATGMASRPTTPSVGCAALRAIRRRCCASA